VGGLTFPAPQGVRLEERLFGMEGQPAMGQAQPLEPVLMEQEDLSGMFDVVVKVNPEAHLEQQKLLTLAERLDAVLAPVHPEGRRLLWRMIWQRLGLQEFDNFYPEAIAKRQTLLQSLGLQVQLAQFELLLTQMLGEGAMQSIQQAQAMTQLSSQEGTPQQAPGPSQQTLGQGMDFGPMIQALAQNAGLGAGSPLAQNGVPETPSSAFAPTT
jgi:hypothetical protein